MSQELLLQHFNGFILDKKIVMVTGCPNKTGIINIYIQYSIQNDVELVKNT